MSTKVVYSPRFGGFGLSKEATKEYLRRKVVEFEVEQDHSLEMYKTGPGRNDYFSDRDIDRTDPVLVDLIEEWGSERCSGRFARLVVAEIPTGVAYLIEEYDGNEYIEYRDNISWDIG